MRKTALLFLCLCTAGAKAQTDTVTAPATTDTTVVADTTATVAASDTLGEIDKTADTIWYNTGIEPVQLHPRHVPPADVTRLRKDDDFWYVSVGPDKPKPEPEKKKDDKDWTDALSKTWVKFMLWTLLVGAAVAALVAIIQASTGQHLFRRTRKLKDLKGDAKDAEGSVGDDPERELTRALEARDFGAAERWLYIRTLSGLGDRGLIKHHPEKTNREYLRELRGHPLYDDFAPLLRHYEYTFYGGFIPSDTAFQTIREQYARFQNRLDAL